MNLLKPWHGKVFFYLCMEDINVKLWNLISGKSVKDNKVFEDTLIENALKKWLCLLFD